MFDEYEPVPTLACPVCAAPLVGWQGKDGERRLFVWREGHAQPVAQRGDEEWLDADLGAFRLPARFGIYAFCICGHAIDAEGETDAEGTWARTRLVDVRSSGRSKPWSARRAVSGAWSCPCCGCFTLEQEPPGSFQICAVCRWEDDRAQLEDVDREIGANDVSLASARRNYLTLGASDPSQRSRCRAPRPDERGPMTP